MKIKVVKKSEIKEEELKSFYNFLKEKEIDIAEDINETDILVVFGGDGTILSIKDLIIKKDIPVLAVNYGHVGYMAEIKKEEIYSMINNVLENNFKTEKRKFLEINVDGEKHYAINEMLIKGGIKSGLLKIDVFSNEVKINSYRSDGMIISTPTGSTAHSLSAGGAIIHPNLNAVSITPLSPQTPNARPIILCGSDNLKFVVEAYDNEMYLNIDGREYIRINNESVITSKLSDKGITLIVPENREYYEILRTKLKWGNNII